MIAIVLPAYNEETSLGEVIQGVREKVETHLPHQIIIIVVDDGSTDNTLNRVQELMADDLIILVHDQNKGLGEALKTGLLGALEINPKVNTIITMDSDNTHGPELILRMIAELDRGIDIVVASRYRKGSKIIGLGWFRRCLSFYMNKSFQILFPISGIRDYSCGYRAYRTYSLKRAFSLWKERFLTKSGFSCMVDILLKLDRLGAKMAEVPMVLNYDKKPGKSKMNITKTIRETFMVALNEKWERMHPVIEP